LNPVAELIGESAGIAAVRDKVERLLQRQPTSRRLPPILIQGETGTGKGLLAHAIHRASPRRDGAFIAVNCAAIPETLLEAELFGFERGAFTDARQAKAGLFQAAHGGTIFLDEVGLLPEALQGKLLMVIEDRVVRRLGSTRSEPVDAWILTATSEDLAALIPARRFREDLYHRLAVLTLWVPPLRERGQDILLLAEHFLARACADYSLPPKRLTPDARAALLAHRWPGNVRELSNILERVALLSEVELVTAETLALPRALPVEPREANDPAIPLEAAVESVERDRLFEALQLTNWNISRAAARLGISRNTLRYRIEKYGLRPGASPPVRRQQAERPAPPAPPPAGVTPAVGVRWEPRRLALLRLLLAGRSESGFPPEVGWALEVVVEKVQSFGGRVEELSPRGLVAVFGLDPVEDAALRAAHAAMAVAKATERSQQSRPVAGKLALHVDQFLVGRIGSQAQLDQETKRRAWRVLDELVELAEPAAVLVSRAAVPLLERRFDLVPLATEPDSPRAYRLAGLDGGGRRGPWSRFVGRAAELELLQSHVAAAVRGRGQVVGIVGEAGIGKSRLLFELRQRLQKDEVTYLEGRCLSYGSAIPYLPLVEMLRSGFRLAEVDTPETIAEKVRRGLEGVGMSPEEALPYLLHFLGVKGETEPLDSMTPEAINLRTLGILWQLTLSASRRRPLILAVEDVHWIDKASEAYLASLAENLPGASVMLVVTYRPGYLPSWIEKSYATQIGLHPLSSQESLSLMHSIMRREQVPDTVEAIILAKAEGNPFFLEELARAVEEQGAATPTRIPDTIQELLLARINRLDDAPKRLLQAAAVVGREASLPLLRAIWEEPDDPSPHLRELMRLELLFEQPGSEPAWVFKHALTQEVAYESLLESRRQALHVAAGEALERLYRDRLDQFYDRLAYHYSKARRADKAVEYLIRSARKAARRFAHAEAVAAFEEALLHAERLPADERNARLLEIVPRLARSLAFGLGRIREALGILLQQKDRVEQLQNPLVAGRYYLLLANTYTLLEGEARTVETAHRAIEEARRCGDVATVGKALYVLAFSRFWSGHFHEGVAHGLEALSLLEQTQERWWLGLACWALAFNHAFLGEFEAALEAVARARAIGQAIEDARVQASAARMAGLIYMMKGEWELAIAACRQALEISPDTINTADSLGYLGITYLEKGEPELAVPLLEQAIEQWSHFQGHASRGWFMTCLGEACLLTGQIEKAQAMANQGLVLTRSAKYLPAVGWAYHALGRIAQASGRLDEAEAHFRAELETVTSIDARYMVGRSHLDLAALAHARGNPEAAASHLREAHRLFETLGVARYVERARRVATEFRVPLEIDLQERV
jgi:transcriptional regulator with AAA-type ATPase domain/tetratricopeptide (TPR) repeat protein